MKNIIDRFIKTGLNKSIEGTAILVLVFGDKLPNEVMQQIVVIIGGLWAIYKFYDKDA